MLVRRTSFKRIYLASIALLLCVISLWFIAPLFAHTVTVKRTSTGFVPDKVLINKGDVVVFENESGVPIWPASDSHPSHGLYPAFDPKEAIAPGDSWSFRFDRPGTWGFHDHLSSLVTGVVLVNGSPGEAARNCVRQSTDTIKAYCWEPEMTALIEEKGLDAAFDHFVELYDTDAAFKRNCHDIGHVLGVAAYEKYEIDGTVIEREQTRYCGFGFYHGFIEAALKSLGSTGLSEGRAYCNSLKKSGAFSSENAATGAASACVHGVGHAIFDSLDGSLWGNAARMTAKAITLCESTFTGEHERSACSSGVYNAIANAFSARTYGLSFDDPDVVGLCRTGPASYRYRCYTEVAVGFVRDRFMSIPDGFDYLIALAYKPGTEAGIYGLIGDEVRRHIGIDLDPAQFRAYCSSLADPDYQSACLEGISVGLLTSGVPGKEYVPMIGFCAGFAEGTSIRSECLEQMFRSIGSISEDQQARMCAEMPASDKEQWESRCKAD